MVDYERSPRVLVVEDDDAIAQVLQRSLRMEGYEVRVADDGIAALDQAHAFLPDLVILDLGLPRLDGIEVAKQLRESDDVPILVLTARDAVEARVEGLDSGADDYLVKPFERQELLARLRALLRRRPPRGQATLTVGDLKLNPDTHEVTRQGRRIDIGRFERPHIELQAVAEPLDAAEHTHRVPFSEAAVEQLDVLPHPRLDRSGGIDELECEIRGA
jgi:DNA-binding response OmpR family regulator